MIKILKENNFIKLNLFINLIIEWEKKIETKENNVIQYHPLDWSDQYALGVKSEAKREKKEEKSQDIKSISVL